jgi:hypothetical protein
LELNIRLDVVDFTGFPFNRGVSFLIRCTITRGGGHRDRCVGRFVRICYMRWPRWAPRQGGHEASRPGDQWRQFMLLGVSTNELWK